jgi:hypothetical protein
MEGRSMKRIITFITFITIIAGLSLVGSVGASQAQARCHGTVDLPETYGAYPYIDVQVSSYRGMTCARAVRVGAAAYPLPGLRPIFGPQFGPGGYGGPFHVGHLSCWLYGRLSDFRIAKCSRGREYVKFYDHRDYWW